MNEIVEHYFIDLMVGMKNITAYEDDHDYTNDKRMRNGPYGQKYPTIKNTWQEAKVREIKEEMVATQARKILDDLNDRNA